jgi:multiple sugar transport system ATP-binding protein
VFGRPANTFVANFIGSTPMNLLSAEVSDGVLRLGGHTLPVPTGMVSALDGEQKVIIGVRPEYVSVRRAATEGALPGHVSIIENLGTASLVTVEVDDMLIGATVPEEDEPQVASAVWLVPNPDRLLIYRAADGALVA